MQLLDVSRTQCNKFFTINFRAKDVKKVTEQALPVVVLMDVGYATRSKVGTIVG